jgi:uncharacterized protein (TIGR01777 family)
MKITLTGATGFIGGHLVKRLAASGHELTILTRHPRGGANPRYIAWDATSVPPPAALDAHAIVHLAGEPVGQRWTGEVKRRIRASRIEGTRAIVGGIAAARNRPKVLVSASAIGIYGSRGDEVLTERSAAGSGFLEDVTMEWERESARANDAGVRVVNPRIGIVLGRGGGALERMLPPFKAGAGGKLGSGHQWMSWIHIDDVAGLIQLALENEELRGALNLTAPNPVTNADFTAELAGALRRPALVPVPVFALKLLFGEMADVLLSSQRVIPQAALDAGYRFVYPELGPALRDLAG